MLADAPDVVSFLNKYSWPAEFQLPAEAWYNENKDKAEYKDEPGHAVAEWFLSEHDAWEAWVTEEAKENIHHHLEHDH